MVGNSVIERFELNPVTPEKPEKTTIERIVDLVVELSAGDLPEMSFWAGDDLVDRVLQPWLNSFLNSVTAHDQLQQLKTALTKKGFLVGCSVVGTSEKTRLDSIVLTRLPR